MIYMDENRKVAIKTLNRLLTDGSIKEDEYFTLLGFVVEDKTQVTYMPSQPQTVPFPFSPIWHDEPLKYEITCKSNAFGDHHAMASSIRDKFK
jgi:hypothetical protein